MMLYKSKVKKRLEEVLSIFPRNTNLFMEYVLSLKVRILDKKIIKDLMLLVQCQIVLVKPKLMINELRKRTRN